MSTDDTGDASQGSLDVTVAWSVNRQFVEHAGNAAPLQQLSSVSAEQIDAPAYPAEISPPAQVAAGKVAAKASFHGVCEDLSDQMRYVIRGIFQVDAAGGG